jgi:Right handed beta helix region
VHQDPQARRLEHTAGLMPSLILPINRRPALLHAAALMVVALLSPVPSQAATIRVERDGSGDFTTIQPAVNAAASGDTVLIGPGRYREFAPFQADLVGDPVDTYIAVSQETLTLMGTDRDSVVIGPDALNFQGFTPYGIAMAQATVRNLIVRDLTISKINIGARLVDTAKMTNCVFTECKFGVVSFSSSAVTVSNCSFTSSRDSGLLTFAPAQNIEVVDCSFVDNRVGVDFAQTLNANVRNCTFQGGLVGIQFEQGSAGFITGSTIVAVANKSVVLTISTQVTLQDNTIIGSGIGLVVDSSHAVASRNTFRGASLYSIDFRAGATGTFRDNHIPLDAMDAVFLRFYGQTPTPILIDMKNNYWGTTDVDSIAAHIHDGNDDATMNAFVEFEPVLTSSVPIEKKSVGSLKGMYRSPK